MQPMIGHIIYQHNADKEYLYKLISDISRENVQYGSNKHLEDSVHESISLLKNNGTNSYHE